MRRVVDVVMGVMMRNVGGGDGVVFRAVGGGDGVMFLSLIHI